MQCDMFSLRGILNLCDANTRQCTLPPQKQSVKELCCNCIHSVHYILELACESNLMDIPLELSGRWLQLGPLIRLVR